MRTDEEILARIKEVESRDWMGTERSDLLEVLPYELAKPFLTEGVTPADWKPASRERADVEQRMLDYMPFAWDKANNGRGLSAGRSMSHYSAWVWLAGDDLGDLMQYQFYGKDNLASICMHYGWEPAQWDDGERSND